MPDTFTLIASSTVGAGGASAIDFTSIPSTYTDLCLVLSGRNSVASVEASVTMQFNGSTSSYNSRWLRGNGSTASSGSDTYGTDEIYIGEVPAASSTSNTFGNASIYIPNYAGSTNKSVSVDMVSENNATTAWAYLTAGLWSNTAAITSIKLLFQSGTFVQYTTAYLYGVKNA
jgi:hypothetical protein